MDNFSDFYHHLAAKPIIVYNLMTKNVNFHILFLFLFLPPTLAFDCKCSLNNKSKIKGRSRGKWGRKKRRIENRKKEENHNFILKS